MGSVTGAMVGRQSGGAFLSGGGSFVQSGMNGNKGSIQESTSQFSWSKTFHVLKCIREREDIRLRYVDALF